jgi:acyl-CoA hydrolase
MHKLYKEKLISIQEAVSKVKPNQVITTGVITTEPPGLLEELGRQKDRLFNVKVYLGFLMRQYDLMIDEDMKNHFEIISFFYGPSERAGHKKGLVSFTPGNLGENTTNILHANKGRVDVFWGVATPPNAEGYVNISIGNVGEKQLIEAADMVVLEINENLPWTYGDTLVHLSEVDYVVENTIPLLEIPSMPKEDWQEKIGAQIAGLIPDGATLQFGIGGIPDAITGHLMDKNDIGIHTEMLTSGIVDLYKSGVITGKKKNLWKEKIVCTFILGNKSLYEFVDNNPVVEVHQGKIVNDPFIIAQHDKMISINTALTVDVRGQVCSQSIGHTHYSGTGGQLDFHTGARRSKGGRGIIALQSTAKGGSVSTIVPLLAHGSEVTVSCHQVDTIITEYGMAEMIGRSVKERTEALINIAHPDFRDQIRDESKKLGFI